MFTRESLWYQIIVFHFNQLGLAESFCTLIECCQAFVGCGWQTVQFIRKETHTTTYIPITRASFSGQEKFFRKLFFLDDP